MSPLEARALAKANELHNLLGEICDQPQHGLGSCVEQAWDLMDDVVWYLDPNAPDDISSARPRGGWGLRRHCHEAQTPRPVA
jgi:hypothetical protein